MRARSRRLIWGVLGELDAHRGQDTRDARVAEIFAARGLAFAGQVLSCMRWAIFTATPPARGHQ